LDLFFRVDSLFVLQPPPFQERRDRTVFRICSFGPSRFEAARDAAERRALGLNGRELADAPG
jgi:hypothetical protein